MNGEPTVLRVLRHVYQLASGELGVAIRIGEVGRTIGLSSYGVSGYLGLLVRLGYLAVAEGGRAVRLIEAGVERVEEEWPDLLPAAAVGTVASPAL